MENKDIVGQILEFVPTINFDVTSTEVSVFETTIRYLGGLLSGETFPRLMGILRNADDADQGMTCSKDHSKTSR